MTNGFMSVQTDDVDEDTQVTDPQKDTQNIDPNLNKDANSHNWEKRYSDQQKYVTKLQNDISDLKDELKTVKSKPLELPTTVEELERFKKEHPGLANSIISLARLELAERDKDLTDRFKEIDERAAAADSANKLDVVLRVHPDAKKIKASQDFADWYNLQSQGTQELFKSADPTDWIRGISIYKEEKGIKTNKSKKEEAAMSVNTPSTPDNNVGKDKKVWKQSEVQKLSDADYSRLRDVIIQAKTEGRYVQDLSQI